MAGYELNLFGGFALQDESGAPVEVVSKKGRCLLACLALAQGQAIHRDRLAGLLWGDRDDTRARHSLSQALYRLRGLFPEDVQAGFALSADTVGLAADLFEVDVLRFEAGLTGGDPEAAEAALALYTGDLLAGLEAGQEGFDSWLTTERERLRDRAIAGWRELLNKHMDASPERAIDAATHLLALDPVDEDAHRVLMQLHVKAGRRDLAFRQYEKCKDALDSELGVEPDQRTRELYETISAAPEPANVGTASTEIGALAPGGEVAIGNQPLSVPSKPSIAVLPFANRSGDPEQDYFSEGVAEEIITALSRYRDLFVISRNSSFTYKGPAINVGQVGRELGVRYILEGGVRKAGDRVRILAQLIEAATGNQLWAEKYDGDLSDIFDLQDTITANVVGAIQPTVFLAEIERARRKLPQSLDAYEMCMKGWAHHIEMGKESLLEARACFLKAIELDERLAQAHTGLAGTHFWEQNLGWSENPQHSISAGLQAAQRAVGIDEYDPAPHVWVGFLTFFLKQFDVALANANRAVELSPNNAVARSCRGCIYGMTGRPDDGITELKLALRLSPRDLYRFMFLHLLAICYYFARDYAAAAESAMRVVALKPDYLYGHWHVAIACGQLGQTERAQAALREVLRIHPNLDRAFVEAVSPLSNPADLEHEIEGLRKAGWQG